MLMQKGQSSIFGFRFPVLHSPSNGRSRRKSTVSEREGGREAPLSLWRVSIFSGVAGARVSCRLVGPAVPAVFSTRLAVADAQQGLGKNGANSGKGKGKGRGKGKDASRMNCRAKPGEGASARFRVLHFFCGPATHHTRSKSPAGVGACRVSTVGPMWPDRGWGDCHSPAPSHEDTPRITAPSRSRLRAILSDVHGRLPRSSRIPAARRCYLPSYLKETFTRAR